jgi:hypothetical protein
MEASLQEILDAREKRVQTQKALLEKFQKPLLCFTMNIPGPVKLDRDISIGFYVGCRLLADALRGCKVLHRQEDRLITGCEGYYVVDMPAGELKQLAIDLEDSAVLVAPLVPWSIAAATPLTTVGAPTGSILFAFFLYMVPITRLLMQMVKRPSRSNAA